MEDGRIYVLGRGKYMCLSLVFEDKEDIFFNVINLCLLSYILPIITVFATEIKR